MLPLSSNGLGRHPFTVEIGVRFPVGVLKSKIERRDGHFFDVGRNICTHEDPIVYYNH
jgi:hypothetical protein